MSVSPNSALIAPLRALVSIMAVWIMIELCSQGVGLLGRNDPMKGLLEGECVYQLEIAGKMVGTRSFENAVTLGKLLETFDRSGHKTWQVDQILDCDSIVNIDTATGKTSLNRIPGSRLMAIGKKISLNRSSKEDLEAIPGIGPRLAERIIETRSVSGGFNSIDELKRVPGVGPKKIAELAQYLKF